MQFSVTRIFVTLLTAPGVQSMPAAVPVAATFNATAGWDDNVYLQATGRRADRQSFVLAGSAEVKASHRSGSGVATLTYLPEVVHFVSESSEDFTRQKLGFGWTAASTDLPHEVQLSTLLTDGPNTPTIWTERGGPPAGGGPAVRDRRDATVSRTRVSLPTQVGEWIVRPTLTGCRQDFRTQQLAVPGCQNSVDRAELIGGVDWGKAIGAGRQMYLGYRYGGQAQARLFDAPERYSNRFHQLLVQWEGQFSGRWSGRIAAGPEWRRYGAVVPSTFGDRDRERIAVDATLAGQLTSRDKLTFCARQHELPGSSGRSIYADTVYEASWTHRWSLPWSVTVAGRAERFDFRAPVARDDWVRTAGVTLIWQKTPEFGLRAELLDERGESELPDFPGREYRRRFFGLSARWDFAPTK